MSLFRPQALRQERPPKGIIRAVQVRGLIQTFRLSTVCSGTTTRGTWLCRTGAEPSIPRRLFAAQKAIKREGSDHSGHRQGLRNPTLQKRFQHHYPHGILHVPTAPSQAAPSWTSNAALEEERILKGKVKPRQEADDDFRRAVDRRQTAGLLRAAHARDLYYDPWKYPIEYPSTGRHLLCYAAQVRILRRLWTGRPSPFHFVHCATLWHSVTSASSKPWPEQLI